MKRALILAFSAVILAGGTSFAQTKKASTAAKQELVPPPMASANAPAVPAHPSPYNFPGVQFPRIEADNRVTFHFNAPTCLLYTSPSPRDRTRSRMPSSA